MPEVSVLAEEATQVSRTFEDIDRELTRVCARLRRLSPEDTGPREVAVAMSEVVTRLERRLSALAETSREAALVARRHGTEPTVGGVS